MRLFGLLAVAAVCGLGTVPAMAQSAVVEDDDGEAIIMNDDARPAAAVDPDADLLDGNSTRVIDPRRDGTSVYGWQGCGTYFYWDGETCVDARAKRGDK